MIIISEDKDQDLSDLSSTVKQSFKSVFPNGWIRVSTSSLGPSTSVFIKFGLVGDSKELPSQILENDPMYHSMSIRRVGNGQYVAELSNGGLKLDPEPGSPYAMHVLKTGWRKATGDKTKTSNSFASFFKRLKGLVAENESKVHWRKVYTNKYFE